MKLIRTMYGVLRNLSTTIRNMYRNNVQCPRGRRHKMARLPKLTRQSIASSSLLVGIRPEGTAKVFIDTLSVVTSTASTVAAQVALIHSIVSSLVDIGPSVVVVVVRVTSRHATSGIAV